MTRSPTPTGATPSMTPDSRNVLWKRSWRDEHLKRICGFANAQGGVLEIGKDDAGEVVLVRGVLGLLEEIPNKAQSLLGIAVDVNLKSDSGREYIEVVVAPHCNPVSYRGEFHYRTGSTKRVLNGAALRRLLRARFGRRWDDVALPGVGLNDLDGRAVDVFRRRAVECERLPPEVLDESVEVLVENLGLRQGAHLKRTATLLFHPSPHRLVPGACVKIGCFRGPDPLFEDVVRGDLFTQVDVTMDLLYTKYTRGLISYDGIYRVETFPVPRSAMREAVINAVVHRDYSSHAPIRIRVRDDRISIRNAARLTPGWSAEKLAGERSSRPHNPSIAYAFLRAGLIEAWGLGIHRMMDTCRELGNPMPRWRPEAEGDGLRVTFPFSEAYRAADALLGGPLPRVLPKNPPENNQKGGTPVGASPTGSSPSCERTPRPAVARSRRRLRALPREASGISWTSSRNRTGYAASGRTGEDAGWCSTVMVRRAGARARRRSGADETRATARYTITARKPPETAADRQKTTRNPPEPPENRQNRSPSPTASSPSSARTRPRAAATSPPHSTSHSRPPDTAWTSCARQVGSSGSVPTRAATGRCWMSRTRRLGTGEGTVNASVAVKWARG